MLTKTIAAPKIYFVVSDKNSQQIGGAAVFPRIAMPNEFHIFTSTEEHVFTVRQLGFSDSRVFPSLHEATGHLRNFAKDSGDCVVIHDEDGKPNRIPLRISQ